MIKEKYPNAYKRWTEKEDTKLIELFRRGQKPKNFGNDFSAEQWRNYIPDCATRIEKRVGSQALILTPVLFAKDHCDETAKEHGEIRFALYGVSNSLRLRVVLLDEAIAAT